MYLMSIVLFVTYYKHTLYHQCTLNKSKIDRSLKSEKEETTNETREAQSHGYHMFTSPAIDNSA